MLEINETFPKKHQVFMIYLFTMYVLAYILAYTGIYVLKMENTILLGSLINFILYGFMFFTFIAILKVYFKQQIKHLEKNIINFVLIGVGGWFLLLFSNVIVYNIMQALQFDTTQQSENQQAVIKALQYPYLTIIFAVIFAPFVEEVFFRGIIFNFFRELKIPFKLNIVLAFLISAVAFGLVHVIMPFLESRNVNELILGIPYVASGFVLAFVYYITKNIWVPIITHFIQNLFSTVLILLMQLFPGLLPEETTAITNEALHIIHYIFK